ncbi:MAG: sugar nucleotide-binding protein, partial [Cellulophaga sp.]|uniref:SDR family oxidoreductase n=1 Tax=Cellulophaga sp. TaxID=1972202 RepID=UPI0032658ECA
HISTDYVFDGEKGSPYTISDSTNPINEYGKSKLKGEQYIKEILEEYFIIRTSWLYSEFGHNFYKTILNKAKEGENLSVIDTEIGCPTDANNLADYILNIIGSDEKDFGIKHFTDEIPMTWFDFAAEILKNNQLDKTTKLVRANNYRSFAKRPKNSTLFCN